MPIEWDDNLKTGIPIIDEQHQELLVMLNRLGRLRCGREYFFEALEELQAYVDTHFKTEEDYMMSIKYSEYDEHKSCHDKFIEDFKTILKKMNEIENFNNELGAELFDFVGEWIINHYSNEDVKLADYIKKQY